MTELLVILGVVVFAGLCLKFHEQVFPVANWLWKTAIFIFTVGVLLIGLMAMVALMMLAIFSLMLPIAVLLALVCLAVLYIPVWVGALIVWAVSRKRNAFDSVNKPVRWLFTSNLDQWLTRSFKCIGKLFGWMDRLNSKLEALGEIAVDNGKTTAAPFVWLSRKLWPRD